MRALLAAAPPGADQVRGALLPRLGPSSSRLIELSAGSRAPPASRRAVERLQLGARSCALSPPSALSSSFSDREAAPGEDTRVHAPPPRSYHLQLGGPRTGGVEGPLSGSEASTAPREAGK